MSSDKERLDVLLVEQGHFESREKAKAALMAGLVLVDGEKTDKAGTKISRSATITIKGAVHPYVSRGGLKLEKAIRLFSIDLKEAVMIDIGSSTGGFTDCALQNGASHVYAVDVGYNQLDWSLRKDPRVKVMERTNFRHMQPEDLGGPIPNFASIDVSFISLKLILPPLRKMIAEAGEVVALIKPQFEAGREKVPKTGVVREPSVHREVVESTIRFAAETGFGLKGLTYSPITGGEGNIEFLAYFQAQEPAALSAEELDKLEKLVHQTVEEAQALHKNPSV